MLPATKMSICQVWHDRSRQWHTWSTYS